MINAELEKRKQDAYRLNEAGIRYAILKRDFDSSRDLYEGLLKKLKEAGIIAGLKSTNIDIVDPAEVPLSPASTPFAASGVHLTATIGPTCPGPVRPGQVCTRPYEGLFVVTDKAGAEVARAGTNQNGLVTIDLPPGDYIITPNIEGRFPLGAPATVTVTPGQFAEVSIGLDSGIR